MWQAARQHHQSNFRQTGGQQATVSAHPSPFEDYDNRRRQAEQVANVVKDRWAQGEFNHQRGKKQSTTAWGSQNALAEREQAINAEMGALRLKQQNMKDPNVLLQERVKHADAMPIHRCNEETDRLTVHNAERWPPQGRERGMDHIGLGHECAEDIESAPVSRKGPEQHPTFGRVREKDIRENAHVAPWAPHDPITSLRNDAARREFVFEAPEPCKPQEVSLGQQKALLFGISEKGDGGNSKQPTERREDWSTPLDPYPQEEIDRVSKPEDEDHIKGVFSDGPWSKQTLAPRRNSNSSLTVFGIPSSSSHPNYNIITGQREAELSVRNHDS